MKREEIKTILDNAELDVEAKLKAIMDINGKDQNDLQSKVKDLTEKANKSDDMAKQIESLNKQVGTYKEFEEKAKKYDDLAPKFEELTKANKERTIKDMAIKNGIDDRFINFAKSEIGEVEDYDKAFKDYAKNNPQFLKANPTSAPATELGKGEGEDDDYARYRKM